MRQTVPPLKILDVEVEFGVEKANSSYPMAFICDSYTVSHFSLFIGGV